MIRILIVDDHPVVRDGLAALLSRRPDMTVVGEAADGEAALALWQRERPDITLMDLRMPVLGGVEAITRLRAAAPAARVIVLTTYDGDEDIFRALQAGAQGYLLKDTPRDDLLAAIRAVHAGHKHLPAAVAGKLAETLTRPALTPREYDVLRQLAAGQSNKEIGVSLGIAEGTVKVHVNSLLGKLGVADRTQAVTAALRRGLLHLD